MRKIVINNCYGGFGLSQAGIDRYLELGGILPEYIQDINRDCPTLVQVVEELGSQANDRHSILKIVEIPDDVKWIVEEYDGKEWVAEEHRKWW